MWIMQVHVYQLEFNSRDGGIPESSEILPTENFYFSWEFPSQMLSRKLDYIFPFYVSNIYYQYKIGPCCEHDFSINKVLLREHPMACLEKERDDHFCRWQSLFSDLNSFQYVS